MTDSGPEAAPVRTPSRRGCFFRFVLLAAGVAVLVALLGGWWVSSRMEHLVEQAISSVLPGIRVRIDEVTWRTLPSVTLSGLALTEKESGGEVVGAVSVTASADWRELLTKKVRRIEFETLNLHLGPQFLKAFQSPSGAPPGEASGKVPFEISEIICRYGEFSLSGLGPEGLVARGKFTFHFRDLFQGGLQTLTLWDVRADDATGADFLVLDLVDVDFGWESLVAGKRLDALRLRGGRLALGERLLALFEPTGNPAPAAESLVVGALEISEIAVDFEDARELAADIGFTLNTTLANIPLGKAASALGEEMQFVEIEDITIHSPFDPLARVLTIRALGVEFSLAGLLRREIASISTTSPSIYVSQGLFWYMDEATRRFAPAGAEAGGGSEWSVRKFSLADGRLILGSGGSASYGLPLTFRTTAQDVSLGNLASLRAQFAMEIPARNYEFADYQLAFDTEPGTLRFAYPPEKEENNLVGTVNVRALRWRQYRAEDSWISVTFDRTGINGLFGGNAYEGYLSGGFSFFFTPESPWIGWISGEGIDTGAVTAIAAPENFRMTGPLDFRTQVDARRKQILRLKGDLRVQGPGQMTITKLDEVLGRIPDDWPALKEDSTRIALEALRDFPYDGGHGDFWFVDGQGVFDLGLQGPLGSRTFKLVLHADNSPAGRWKNNGETHE